MRKLPISSCANIEWSSYTWCSSSHSKNIPWCPENPSRDQYYQVPKGEKKTHDIPGDSSRDPTWSPIVGGHFSKPWKGHLNSPSQKGHQQNCQVHSFYSTTFLYRPPGGSYSRTKVSLWYMLIFFSMVFCWAPYTWHTKPQCLCLAGRLDV